MELTLLLSLLASLQSLPRPVSAADPRAAPAFSLSPSHQRYVSQESGKLTCSAASEEDEITKYQFSKDEGSIVPPGSSYADVRNLEQQPACSGSYTCWYWTGLSGQEIQSAESPPVSITVIAWPPAPQLDVTPRQDIFLHDDSVTLTCSAPRTANLSKIQFFRDDQRIDSGESHQPQYDTRSLLLSVSESHASVYSCEYWQTESGREIPSERSQNITIKVTDPPPQPVLSMDPPSGVLSERLPLLLTCVAPGSERERRFHFYRNGTKFDSGDMGSERSILDPTNISMNISVLSITQAGPNNTGEFTCGYEQKVGNRWIPSPQSRTVTVTLTASSSAHNVLLGTGGVLLLIAALAALLCYCCRKKRVPKTLKSTNGSEPREQARNLDPSHDSKGSKVTGAGAEQTEQGSEVTYTLLVLPDSQAHMTQSTNKAKPVEDEYVLYSEVMTTRTQKAAK
ncbi:low affinity immunoglobulin gamma Fc region receptor II-b-like isoform X2 [Pelodiscus sinensis]|uniref:low affinity immunoglobulin gamma Fc region receptor II-b-like isoform X2 n=1 Tax=Pelodiscus sinensis TaxID=13735 RepID=UPI003F6A66D4